MPTSSITKEMQQFTACVLYRFTGSQACSDCQRLGQYVNDQGKLQEACKHMRCTNHALKAVCDPELVQECNGCCDASLSTGKHRSAVLEICHHRLRYVSGCAAKLLCLQSQEGSCLSHLLLDQGLPTHRGICEEEGICLWEFEHFASLCSIAKADFERGQAQGSHPN